VAEGAAAQIHLDERVSALVESHRMQVVFLPQKFHTCCLILFLQRRPFIIQSDDKLHISLPADHLRPPVETKRQWETRDR